MTFTRKGKATPDATVVKMVEAIIETLSLSASESRIDSPTGPAWGLMKGSAEVFIFLHQARSDKEESHLQVISPVMHPPPSQSTRLVLFQRLLELNANELVGAAFAIKKNAVVAVADRTTVDLDRSEIEDMVLRVGHYADHYDDRLVGEFGGSRHSDKP